MDALKVVSFIRRRADFGLAEFSQYWRTTHKDHALALAEAGFFQGYIQNHAVEPQPDGLTRIADGAPELWIRDLADLQRLVDSREYREGAGPDEARFMTPPAVSCVVRERLVAGRSRGPALAGAVKLMLVVDRDPGLSREAFQRCWLADDGPLGRPAVSPLRLTRQAVQAGPEDTPFDGVECSWWPDTAAARQAWSSRDNQAGQGLVDRRSLRGLLVREEIVLAPPEPA
ncbi:EthD domain-containing protein [Zoogloea sp.]|uniref:EthD domain-containing protein n=1 Tax=Zoogloea sp. TaxID=49181 RepID=UPI002624D325|nr:EthD domain-containing protein [Zoogloea sp.]MDD3352070.1 EthD domain-containing protein [Zoogloea sp.]